MSSAALPWMVTSTPATPPISTGFCRTSGGTGTCAMTALNAARRVWTSPPVSSPPWRRMASNWRCWSVLISTSSSLDGSGAGRDAGLPGDVVLAGSDQGQNGQERRGDQPGADPEGDVIAVDRRERIERGRREVMGDDKGRDRPRIERVQQRRPQGPADLLGRVEHGAC